MIQYLNGAEFHSDLNLTKIELDFIFKSPIDYTLAWFT